MYDFFAEDAIGFYGSWILEGKVKGLHHVQFFKRYPTETYTKFNFMSTVWMKMMTIKCYIM